MRFSSRSCRTPHVAPIIEKKLGEKSRKMIYTSDGDHPTRNVPTSKAERAAFVLSDADILALARWACAIEDHYGRPMDMEWAKDGETGELFIVQARPETVQSRKEASAFKSYRIKSKGRKLVSGLSIGEAVVSRSGLPDRKSARDRSLRRRRNPGDADDRPRLGADHEARGRHHHRSRRPHLACRHRQPRIGPAGGRRHRQCDAASSMTNKR